MKKKNLPAIIEASSTRGRLGLKSKIAEKLQGKPLIYHTVERLLKSKSVSGVWIVSPSKEKCEIKKLVEGLPVKFFSSNKPGLPGLRHTRRGRKWALGSWRGGLGHSFFCAETLSPERLVELCNKESFKHILLAPASAPLIAPELIDSLVNKFYKEHSHKKIYLSTCPPGLGADLMAKDSLKAFARAKKGIEGILDFRLDSPEHYIDGMGVFHWYSNSIAGFRTRLCGDTDRSLARIRAISEQLGGSWKNTPAQELINILQEDHRLLSGDFPQEILVEITSRRNLCGPADGPEGIKGDIKLKPFEQILKEAGKRDDVRLTLGIHGEPLLHPEIKKILELTAENHPFGFHLHTDCLSLDEDILELLVKADPDVVSVNIDAATPETYKKLHGIDGLEKARKNLELLLEKLSGNGGFIIPEFALCDLNREEVEPFYDLWYKKTGWVVVTDHNDLAGQIPMLATRSHLPSERNFCAHLSEEIAVMPDSSIVPCLQDILATRPIGKAGEDSIQESWLKRPLKWELCKKCRSWAC